MHIYILLFTLFLPFSQLHALDWYQLERGTSVELTENLTVNKLRARASLHCRIGMKVVYPRGSIGPRLAENVIPVRFLTVVEKYSDVVTYRVILQSNQLPCSCVVTVDQTPSYLNGGGFDFKMFSLANEAARAKEPGIASSCANNPDWLEENPEPAYDIDDDVPISM